MKHQFSHSVMYNSLDAMDCSMPGFPVHHQLLELAQNYGQWVRDAIQPSHPLSFPSLPDSYISQHQDLFQWVSFSYQVDVQAGLEKAEEPEIKLPTSAVHGKSKRVPEKSIYFCFIEYAKAFDCVDHNKLWKILKEIGIPDHLICLLRRLVPNRKRSSSRLYIVILLI